MATIKDIAKMTGYSTGTVSRVLNNKADVSAKARASIEKAIKDLGFQPNANAQMLKQAISSGVYVIVRGMNNRFLVSLLENIQGRLIEHGVSTGVIFLNEVDNEIQTAKEIIRSKRPEGVVFLGGSSQSFSESFAEIGIPCVLVTASAKTLHYDNLSSISTDDYFAALFAVKKLIENHHTRIGIIGGMPVSYSEDNTSRRLSGAFDALREAGLHFDKERDYVPCLYSLEEGYTSGCRLLDQNPDITAVFALSDMVALGAMRAFRDRGMSVPEDISIIGFDGIDITRYSNPRLSTIQQNVQEISDKCVEDLLLRVSYPRPASHITVPFSFVEGESIAWPREDR